MSDSLSQIHPKSISTTVIDWLSKPITMNGGSGNSRDRDNPRDLDETRSGIPRDDSEFRVNDRRAQIPQWMLLFLIIQCGTGIWWAATMQSDLKYLQLENAKLWTRIEAIDRSKKDLESDVRSIVANEVATQLVKSGIIRIHQNP